MTENEKKEAVLRYQESMAVFQEWCDNGVLSLDDLRIIDTKMAEKYGISLSSIYRPQALLLSEEGVTNVMPEGGENSHDDIYSETTG